MEIEYIGEHIGVSVLGHALVIIAFVSVLFSSLSYFLSTQGFSEKKESDLSWTILGRWLFRVHSFAVFSLVGLLFYMLLNGMYEFFYVYKHSNDIMPLKYILSCFWAGQEGSYLLWVICQVALGLVLQVTSKSWESHVMTIYGLVQGFLVSMLLGIVIPGGVGVGVLVALLCLIPVLLFMKRLNPIEGISFLVAAVIVGLLFTLMDFDELVLGSNPFVLLTRDSESFYKDELFTNADYLSLLQGQGLNPLLQNYWMTIHPPTLFVGFASTLVPFCYAVAGLWRKQFNEWMTPVLPWIFFGIMILGTGILMGGAWAYESLTFGGFWAWDPVENASLFPWLTFVGAAHVMIIQKRKGSSSYISFLMTIFSFLFVLFSTFLTRSGVLAETSVHSFASGGSGQLLFFLLFMYWFAGMLLLQGRLNRLVLTALSLALFWLNLSQGNIPWANGVFVLVVFVLFVVDYTKSFGSDSKEDHFTTREFWVFLGAILLMLSCFQLIFKTSLPVFNAMFGVDKVLQKTEIVSDYAIPQMIIASLVCLVMGFALFFKYKKTKLKDLFKYTTWAMAAAVLITSAVIALTDFDFGQDGTTKVLYPIFFTLAMFTVLANLIYFIVVLKAKFKNAGAAVAHFGFGLLLVGAFISTSQSEIISKNESDFSLEMSSGGKLLDAENVKINIGDTVPLGDYLVTYKGKYQEGVNVFFQVDYLRKSDGQVVESFTLNPFIQTNERFGRVAEPDTRHYLLNDLYTHITSANPDTSSMPSYLGFETLRLKKEEAVEYKGYTFSFKHIDLHQTAAKTDSFLLSLNVQSPAGELGEMQLPVAINKGRFQPYLSVNEALGVRGGLRQIQINEGVFELSMSVQKKKEKDFIVMKAINFPLINLLWLGCVIMIVGTLMAIRHRIQLSKKSKSS